MPAKSEPRAKPAAPKYFYRRPVSLVRLLPAFGVGIAAGIAAFYVARLYLERTPLVPDGAERTIARRRRSPVTSARGG